MYHKNAVPTNGTKAPRSKANGTWGKHPKSISRIETEKQALAPGGKGKPVAAGIDPAVLRAVREELEAVHRLLSA